MKIHVLCFALTALSFACEASAETREVRLSFDKFKIKRFWDSDYLPASYVVTLRNEAESQDVAFLSFTKAQSSRGNYLPDWGFVQLDFPEADLNQLMWSLRLNEFNSVHFYYDTETGVVSNADFEFVGSRSKRRSKVGDGEVEGPRQKLSRYGILGEEVRGIDLPDQGKRRGTINENSSTLMPKGVKSLSHDDLGRYKTSMHAVISKKDKPIKIKLKNSTDIEEVRFIGVHYSGYKFSRDVAAGDTDRISDVPNGYISLTVFRKSDQEPLDTLVYGVSNTMGFAAVLLYDETEERYRLVGEGFVIPKPKKQ
jgi:hypothetical protein